MYELKKIGKLFTSKFVGTGPSFYKKGIYRAAVSQRLRNTVLSGLLPSGFPTTMLYCLYLLPLPLPPISLPSFDYINKLIKSIVYEAPHYVLFPSFCHFPCLRYT
jgi:hypothetical protein